MQALVLGFLKQRSTGLPTQIIDFTTKLLNKLLYHDSAGRGVGRQISQWGHQRQINPSSGSLKRGSEGTAPRNYRVFYSSDWGINVVLKSINSSTHCIMHGNINFCCFLRGFKSIIWIKFFKNASFPAVYRSFPQFIVASHSSSQLPATFPVFLCIIFKFTVEEAI